MDNCTTQPAVPPTPATRIDTPVQGWDSGANSVDMLDGNVLLNIPAPSPAVGIAIGLKSSRLAQTVPELIEFAWWFLTPEVGPRIAYVCESGKRVSPYITYRENDDFSILRHRGKVTYRKNDELVHTSQHDSIGLVLTNACLYMTGDTLP